MSKIIIKGQECDVPDSMMVQNFLMPGVTRFNNQKRNNPVTEIIIHDTVTSSARATVDVLLQRNLGVHFIVGPEGTIYQHGDLYDDMLWHASQHNGPSVGIETVNPYVPEYMPHGGPWKQVIDAPWAKGKKYVVPTALQSEAVALLVDWLVSPAAKGLSIPRRWTGLVNKRYFLQPFPLAHGLAPGIYAHHHFNADHFDGPFLALYAWLRLEPKLDPDTAYAKAIEMSKTPIASVDLGEFYVADPTLST